MNRKRKILFLGSNCEGLAIVDDRDGILKRERVYCLNSILEEWSLVKPNDISPEENFYKYFKES
jgi:hypothetical protein